MQFLLAIKLLGFVLGVALQASLFVLIKRYRRIRKLERILLVLISCLFLWNLCNFISHVFESLELTPMTALILSAAVDPLAYCTLAVLPSLLLHIHLVFQETHLGKPIVSLHWPWEVGVYAPLIFLPWALADFLVAHPARILAPIAYAKPYAAWFSLVLLGCAFIEWRLLRDNQKLEERNLYRVLISIFVAVAVLVFLVYWVYEKRSPAEIDDFTETILLLWSNIPSALLGYYIFRYNFLEIAIQRSLGYSVVGILLLVMYLFVVRGLRDFLEDRFLFPGILVEAAMILALFALAQPLKRWMETWVNHLFSLRMARFSGMTSRLDEVSRSTFEINSLIRFTQNLLRSELGLEDVELVLYSESFPGPEEREEGDDNLIAGEKVFLRQGEKRIGELRVSGRLSTEQQAGVQLIATQFVTALENCKLAQGKIELERELAERDKLATLGQMAAAVAHNVKNPLSSIKTIVQLMQEDAALTRKYGGDLNLVTEEIDRLSHSVGQLLKFSRPAVAGQSRADVGTVLRKIQQMFQADALRRQIRLQLSQGSPRLPVSGTEEVLLEIFQNLVVNALEAAPAGSQITVAAEMLKENKVRIRIDDEGPGIPAQTQPDIFRPFFTTKQRGTGLGLAVAQRRVMDLGGEISCYSPISEKGGTRFEVTLVLMC